jgi:acetoin utilization deacetylase AcuC-like enzyme
MVSGWLTLGREIPCAGMPVTRRAAVVEDRRYLEHRGPSGHPERPERLAAVGAAIAEREAQLSRIDARAAEPEEILRVHPRAHVEHVARSSRSAAEWGGRVQLDPDTYVSPGSFEVARLAAGASIDLAAAVARGDVASGIAAVRPPGHHAEVGRAMGFCLLNNVAIAARAISRAHGVERILIVDWDVHHGNGTQQVFEEDPDVLYFSTHQFPYYPGTGDAREAGSGLGAGATVNVPMPAGCGDAEYLGVLRRILVPVARRHRPDLILVSCGFDAHRSDPLASMEVTGEGFRDMTRVVRALADELCRGRLAFVLEGGYSAQGLREGTAAVLDVLLDPDPPPLGAAPALEAGSVLRAVVDRVAMVHGSDCPGIGAA